MGRFERGIQTASVDAAMQQYGSDRLFIRVKHGTAYAVVGDPDLYGALDGHFFGFEVKNEEGKLTKIQLHRLKEIERAGGFSAAVESVEETLQKLKYLEDCYR